MALEGDKGPLGEEAIAQLASFDSHIPEPERAVDGAFLMPIEDVFLYQVEVLLSRAGLSVV